MQSLSKIVSDFYNQFPFPLKAIVLEQPFYLNVLNFWGSYHPEKKLPQDLSILVAGCGTNEAICMALSFPHAKITAIDLSPTSLAVSEKLAQNFGIKNVTFDQQDILCLSPNIGPFDYISSMGVLHHLKDPLAGLQNLTKFLKPDGIMKLMLYSETHRYFIARIQKIIKLLAGDHENLEKQLEVAQNFVESADPQSWPYGVYIDQAKMRDLAKVDPPAFTDTFIHPHEVSFNYKSLHQFLNDGGLELVQFANPLEWNTAPNMYGNRYLSDCFHQLPIKTRHEVIDMLNGPLYIFYARPLNTKNEWYDWTQGAVLKHIKPFINPLIRHYLNQDLTRSHQETLQAKIHAWESPKAFVRLEYNGQSIVDNFLLSDLIMHCHGELTLEQITSLLAQKYKLGFEQTFKTTLHLIKRLLELKLVTG